MKKIVAVLLMIALTFSFSSCSLIMNVLSSKIEVPDVKKVDEDTAKNVLSSNSLIPTVEYIYHDTIAKGLVVKTYPSIGEMVEKNARITVYVSLGPSYVESKNSRISWTNLTSSRDEWSFYSPYIKNDVLHIECKVAFATAVKWQDTYQNGKIIGEASLTSGFDRSVPASAKYTKQSWKANEEQSFILEIPLQDLNVDKPTNIYVELYRETGSNVEFNFTIAWQ